MKVCDLFAGAGGFSTGVTQSGAEVVLAIEADADIARIYMLNHDHAPRVETLGGDVDALAQELARIDELHLHGSPPCQRLSQANQKTRDPTEGLRLVMWYLDLVKMVKPRTWSMEQVPASPLKALLHERGVPFTIVDTSDFGVPQRRTRLIAGSPCIIAALEKRKNSGPTILPKDVLPSLQPASRFMLTNATSNQPIKIRRNGVRVTEGYRRMTAGEGGRDLYTPCHTIWSKPGRVFDSVNGESVRRLTPSECAVLQGFPSSYELDERSIARSYKVIGNAIPPPLARFMCEAAMNSLPHMPSHQFSSSESSSSTGLCCPPPP